MVIELSKRGIQVEDERSIKVYYEDRIVGDFFADLLVGGDVVVELKSVQRLAKEHEVQLVNYLKALRKDFGLLINFGPEGIVVKRKYRKFKPLNGQD